MITVAIIQPFGFPCRTNQISHAKSNKSRAIFRKLLYYSLWVARVRDFTSAPPNPI